jgi:drug/metabolite transporter (DMT)-like permease
VRTALFTIAALICFAANSLLTRGALGHALLDAPTFTIIRLATGAAMLAVLLRARGTPPVQRGTWTSAVALAGYAVAFTLAYTRIGAGVGALLLFGAVQVTMIATGLARGERPLIRDWVGLLLAASGLAWLTLPGASAPDLTGAALMVIAGASWGAYSIVGRGSRDPLAATAGNFWRATILGIAALAPVALFSNAHAITWGGVLLAAASGAIASGVGYTFWYSALTRLTAWRAALVQLTVPVMTALAAIVILAEPFTNRLLVATALVSSGVALTLVRPRDTRRA